MLTDDGNGVGASHAAGLAASQFDGSGVGVAVIDSGVTAWHDDLARNVSNGRGPIGQRVMAFVDFVDGAPTAHDDFGHGTHVAGIIAGSGWDAAGQYEGVAPGADLLVLRVLNGQGQGSVSDVIRAIDFAVANRARFHVRVINLSIGAAVFESYETDPLTLAAKRAVDAGLVVVTAAGNLGKDANGNLQYGGITAPGNAPWVITVGAYNEQGTPDSSDDTVATFSSRGPTAIDATAKPDLVAPGIHIVSLNDPNSYLSGLRPDSLVAGTRGAAFPYLSLSGTSMAAPVVAGTVALMIQANPSLTPNLVKAILQYTAEHKPRYNEMTQGAGFLNARGAVQVARSLTASSPGADSPTITDPTPWNKHINWGNHRIGGGVLRSDANAWRLDVTWGASSTSDGNSIVWGTVCKRADDCGNVIRGSIDEEDNIVWGTSCADATCSDVVWGPSTEDNIVWGTACGGSDCANTVWGLDCDRDACGGVVWGTSSDEDNIVWGTSTIGDVEDVVWRFAQEHRTREGGQGFPASLNTTQ